MVQYLPLLIHNLEDINHVAVVPLGVVEKSSINKDGHRKKKMEGLPRLLSSTQTPIIWKPNVPDSGSALDRKFESCSLPKTQSGRTQLKFTQSKKKQHDKKEIGYKISHSSVEPSW